MIINHSIIGCGRVSQNHLYACSKLENVNLKHFCDINIDNARFLASTTSFAVCCSDCKEIVNDPNIDSVSVCTDHGSHFEIALKCIQAGKHVIIEKPV